MRIVEADVDWEHWFERWEAMQNCYVPQRLYRFDLMLRSADLPRDAESRILDLGCGPGALSLRALVAYPNAHVLAVDANPILLAMGQSMARKTTGRLQFLQVDLRQADWWTAYPGTFDLVLSATALHWLSPAHLAQTYRSIYGALKPGGWFLNSDHIASDYPETQGRYRQMLRASQTAAFRAAGADDWDGFWQSLSAKLDQPLAPASLRELALWEGTDDGQPKQFHIAELQKGGFELVELYWQDLGEGVIGARKPVAR